LCFNFLNPIIPSSLANFKFRAGFHCIRPRCLRASVFFIKYGIIVGAIALVAGWLMGSVSPNDLLPARTTGRLGTRPKPWEPFHKHTEYNRRWKARYSYSGTVRANNMDEGRRIVEGVLQYVWDSAQRVIAQSVFANALGLGEGAARQQEDKSPKAGKGKGTRSR